MSCTTYKLLAGVGTYNAYNEVTKKVETRTRWRQVGVFFEHDDGRKSALMDTVPVGQGWDGSLVIKPMEERDHA